MSNNGLFNISEDHIEKYQSLDARFIRNKSATFFMLMDGNSMSPLIHDKDILIIDRSLEVIDKRIVIVSLYDEMICRRYIEIDESIILRCENSLYKDIYVTREMNMMMFGTVRGIARETL
ncbi:MAG: S24 family peptidase [Bdellovibrionales bacterium]|nr:S24 family peptidase [Bdellovibrionales bacterium]NQZ17955.1 S24 family peptidase [Bdellovibrionales bacterium]